eukprot:CAMPEP_0171198810 /NCGR_PEP_ID=MMETSP0790-20130122/23139_1 /TAXON_ID=2925 /ORGANISM="Alexandrium catenella, Strain OF101" /LENGTH=210 /DNA_ID=CAMNT_0011664135 /DNA_START=96 /DNA_END=729 /DNA_ORIENTATION=+
MAENTNVFIADLPVDMDDAQLLEIFSQYGTVAWSKMMPSKGKPSQAGIVEFASIDEAKWVVENLNGNVAQGMSEPIQVNYKRQNKGYGKDGKGGKSGGYGKDGGFGGKSCGKGYSNGYQKGGKGKGYSPYWVGSPMAASGERPALSRAVGAISWWPAALGLALTWPGLAKPARAAPGRLPGLRPRSLLGSHDRADACGCAWLRGIARNGQ